MYEEQGSKLCRTERQVLVVWRKRRSGSIGKWRASNRGLRQIEISLGVLVEVYKYDIHHTGIILHSIERKNIRMKLAIGDIPNTDVNRLPRYHVKNGSGIEIHF